MEVPRKQWDELVGREAHPLAMYIALARSYGYDGEYYKIDFRLDGSNSHELALAMAFFFVMDDYGQMVFRKILRKSGAMLTALEKMEKLMHGKDYTGWKEAQQQMFIELCKEYEAEEEEHVARNDTLYLH